MLTRQTRTVINSLLASILCASFLLSPAFAQIKGTEILWKVPTKVVARGIYFHNREEIWLTDMLLFSSSRSQVYNPAGEAYKGLPAGVGLAGIAKHPTKDIYSFCDYVGSMIILTTRYGQPVARIRARRPANARWSPTGDTLFVVNQFGEVVTIDNAGNQTVIFNGLDHPLDVAPISDDLLWVSEQGTSIGTGKVTLLERDSTAPAGHFRKVVVNDGAHLSNAGGLWPVHEGEVLVADIVKGHLIKVARSGKETVVASDIAPLFYVQALGNGEWVALTREHAVIYGRSEILKR